MSTNAAQYVRMSTDLQDLSIGIQKAAIAQYAASKGLAIVASYEDEGRSGMHIRNRDGMQRLLRDVMEPHCPFSWVLVYDVSRWGRFQNTDASAYYDYHCRLNGAEVVYVAENFGDAQTPMATLVRSLKRAMAAEYSRELGVKVRAGQARAVSLGFEIGALPAMGYRRQAYSAAGEAKAILGRLERKGMQSDRVRWVLGPDAEVALVRRIFRLYASGEKNVDELTRMLNAEGRTNREGKPLTNRMIGAVLDCEAFTGSFVWGRQMQVDGHAHPAPHDRIVRVAESVPPIVSRSLFDRARRRRQGRKRVIRDKERMLSELRAAMLKNPTLTAEDLGSLGCASSTAYDRAFGSIRKAYALVGRDFVAAKATLLTRRRRTLERSTAFQRDLAALARSNGLELHETPGRRILFFRGLRIGFRTIYQAPTQLGLTWYARKTPGSTAACDYVVAARMRVDGTALDFFLVRESEYRHFPARFGDQCPRSVAGLRCKTGQELVERIKALVDPREQLLPRLQAFPRRGGPRPSTQSGAQ